MIFVITKRKTVEYLNVIPLSLKPNIPYRTGLSKFKTGDNKKKRNFSGREVGGSEGILFPNEPFAPPEGRLVEGTLFPTILRSSAQVISAFTPSDWLTRRR